MLVCGTVPDLPLNKCICVLDALELINSFNNQHMISRLTSILNNGK